MDEGGEGVGRYGGVIRRGGVMVLRTWRDCSAYRISNPFTFKNFDN
jgi:hypothetical protein